MRRMKECFLITIIGYLYLNGIALLWSWHKFQHFNINIADYWGLHEVLFALDYNANSVIAALYFALKGLILWLIFSGIILLVSYLVNGKEAFFQHNKNEVPHTKKKSTFTVLCQKYKIISSKSLLLFPIAIVIFSLSGMSSFQKYMGVYELGRMPRAETNISLEGEITNASTLRMIGRTKKFYFLKNTENQDIIITKTPGILLIKN